MLTACSERVEPTPQLLVLTNHPDVAFAVELYNAEFGEQARLRYASNLTEALTQERTGADLVIGAWIRNPSVLPLMTPIGELAAADSAGSRSGRAGLELPIAASVLAQHDRLVPLAYTVPLIAFRPDRATLPTSRTIQLSDLGTELREVPQRSGSEPPAMRFIPTFQPTAAYAIAAAAGLTVEVESDGLPAIAEPSYERARTLLSDWNERYNGPPQEIAAYVGRFLYERNERLLATGRVRALYYSSEDLFSQRFFERNDVEFRILAGESGELRAGEDIVYAGVPTAATSRTRALRFLRWIVDPATQTTLIEKKIESGVSSFGLFGGFSTVSEATVAITTEIYPRLAGRIPQASSLILPGVLPRYWNEAREAVVEPALATGAGFDEVSRSLDRWYRQRGD